jgi:hypothetical protein
MKPRRFHLLLNLKVSTFGYKSFQNRHGKFRNQTFIKTDVSYFFTISTPVRYFYKCVMYTIKLTVIPLMSGVLFPSSSNLACFICVRCHTDYYLCIRYLSIRRKCWFLHLKIKQFRCFFAVQLYISSNQL